MNRIKSLRPTPALIVALVALVAAMSGAAVALPGKNTVTSNDIVTGAVTTKKIAKGAVGSQQILGKSIKGNRLKDGAIRDKQLADGSVTAAKVADGVIDAAKLADGSVTAAKITDATITGQQVADEGISSANISDYGVLSSAAGSLVKLTATDGADEAAARTAAPETTLFEKGDITISAKCFRSTGANQTFAEVYVATAANGAVFNGGVDALQGGNAAVDFLNIDTDETDRVLDDATATGTDASINENEFTVIGADSTHLIGQTTVAAKNGALAGGNGVYGEGNVCLFGGEISG